MANVAVIGGGISGLSCAYYLRKLGQDVVRKVTLSERQPTLGGWIQTTCFPDGTLYEHGPNTLRVSGREGYNTLALIDDLGLASEVLHVTNTHPSANKRLILVDGKLHELPSSLGNIFRRKEPFQKATIWYMLKDLMTKKTLLEDESMDDFARRRFGHEMADYVFDSMCRGLTAGSSKDTSIRSLMPKLFDAEQLHGSAIKGMLKVRQGKFLDRDLPFVAKRDKWSMLTFRKGLQQLPIVLEAHLESDDRVRLYHNIPCDRIHFKTNTASVYFEGQEIPDQFDHIFACVPAKKLSRIFSSHHSSLANHLSAITSVNVAVVNLEYKGKPFSQEGFGYLVPSSEKSKILGVIFNSCIFPEHDGKYADKTRLTCMMGGKWFRDYFGDVDSVNPDDLLEIAASEVGRHLQIQDKPVRHNVRIHKNCIAQYRIGHHKILESLEKEIQSNSLSLSLVGASYVSGGVNACIYDARVAVEKFLDTLKSKTS